MFGGSAAAVLGIGGGAIYGFKDTNWFNTDFNNHLGTYLEYGVGLGFDMAHSHCQATPTKDPIVTVFKGLKPRCPSGGCFPAHAVVETTSGLKTMKDLRVGDKILAVDENGNFLFDDVYFFGHADPGATSSFVRIIVHSVVSDVERTLELSKKHFLPVCPHHLQQCTWSQRVHAYALSVLEGDYLWASASQGAELCRVTKVSSVIRSGLYNPYSLTGNIVVNGVLASAHSDWILDSLLSGHESYLPSIYQALFFPGRVLYHTVGAKAANWLEVNNPQMQSEVGGYGPHFLSAIACGFAMVGCSIVKRYTFAK